MSTLLKYQVKTDEHGIEVTISVQSSVPFSTQSTAKLMLGKRQISWIEPATHDTTLAALPPENKANLSRASWGSSTWDKKIIANSRFLCIGGPFCKMFRQVL